MKNSPMFLLLAIVCTLMLVGIFGCAHASPTQPTQTEQTEVKQVVAEIHYIPLHHNIPATFAGHPEGPMVWLCATQPRLICDRDLNCERAEDHYLQYETCPEVPIK